MRPRFTLFRRNATYYCEDTETGQQLSLRTKDEAEAHTLLHAKNESVRQAHLNLQLARTYLAASDPLVGTRTWQDVMNEIPKLKIGSTRVRWEIAIKAKVLDPIRSLPLLQTRAEHFLHVLENGGVSTILMHNHPSGEPAPSEADIKVTRDLIRAGQPIKVEVLDHVIIGTQTTPACASLVTSINNPAAGGRLHFSL